jgi:hypothetical protein
MTRCKVRGVLFRQFVRCVEILPVVTYNTAEMRSGVISSKSYMLGKLCSWSFVVFVRK